MDTMKNKSYLLGLIGVLLLTLLLYVLHARNPSRLNSLAPAETPQGPTIDEVIAKKAREARRGY